SLDLAGNPGALERAGESHAAANHDAAHTMGSSLSFRVLVARRNNLIVFNVSARLSMNNRCFPRRFRATTDWRETKSVVALNLRGKPCVHGPNARQFGRGGSP